MKRSQVCKRHFRINVRDKVFLLPAIIFSEILLMIGVQTRMVKFFKQNNKIIKYQQPYIKGSISSLSLLSQVVLLFLRLLVKPWSNNFLSSINQEKNFEQYDHSFFATPSQFSLLYFTLLTPVWLCITKPWQNRFVK